MPDLNALQIACDEIRAAALTGAEWGKSLQLLARAADARGVVILHNRNRRLIAHLSNADIKPLVDDYLAGKAPPNRRQTKVSHDRIDGFRFDHDDFDDPEIAHDPFYQDYLRPEGLGWHANARLNMTGADEIAVSFKRDAKSGPYASGDRRALDRILAALRLAADISGAVLDAEARGVIKIVSQPGAAAAELDAWGFVRREHGDLRRPGGPLRLRGMRLIAARAQEQRGLDLAVDLVTRGARRQTYLRLSDGRDGGYALRVVRVTGDARDVFNATAAIAVLTRIANHKREAPELSLAGAVYNLNARELDIARRLCAGQSIAGVAEALALTGDGVRYHMKTMFQKTGTHRQAELIALLMGHGG